MAASSIGHNFLEHNILLYYIMRSSQELTRLADSYLLRGENQLECYPLTVKHILIDCVSIDGACQRYFSADTLNERTFR